MARGWRVGTSRLEMNLPLKSRRWHCCCIEKCCGRRRLRGSEGSKPRSEDVRRGEAFVELRCE